MRIADVLSNKGAAVATIAPETTVSQLLASLAALNIGAMVVVGDDLAEKAMEAIQKAACTGKIGDGKIFVQALEQSIRIRTGETGDAAL